MAVSTGLRAFFVLLVVALCGCAGHEQNVVDPYSERLEIMRIRSFSPNAVPQGDIVKIMGRKFHPQPDSNTVLFAPQEQGAVLFATDSSLVVIVPMTAEAGKFPFVVQVGGVSDTSREELQVVSARIKPAKTTAVVISDFAPQKVKGGFEMRITGSGFLSKPDSNEVLLGTRRAEVLSATATQLVVKVPDGVEPDYIAITRWDGNISYTARSATKYEVYRDGEILQPVRCHLKLENVQVVYTDEGSCLDVRSSNCNGSWKSGGVIRQTFEMDMQRLDDTLFSCSNGTTTVSKTNPVVVRRLDVEMQVAVNLASSCQYGSFKLMANIDNMENLPMATPTAYDLRAAELTGRYRAGGYGGGRGGYNTCICDCSLGFNSFEILPNTRCRIEFFYW